MGSSGTGAPQRHQLETATAEKAENLVVFVFKPMLMLGRRPLLAGPMDSLVVTSTLGRLGDASTLGKLVLMTSRRRRTVAAGPGQVSVAPIPAFRGNRIDPAASNRGLGLRQVHSVRLCFIMVFVPGRTQPT
jgi:hypothetical protein